MVSAISSLSSFFCYSGLVESEYRSVFLKLFPRYAGRARRGATVAGDHLRGTAVVVENAPKSLSRHDGTSVIRACRQRCEELVAETLVVPFCVIVHYVFGYRIKAHWGAIAATDLFTVEVVNPFGLVRYHVLFVIDIATRCVCIGGITSDPNGEWMKQVVRNLTDMWDGFLLGKRYLIHDRDPLFTEGGTRAVERRERIFPHIPSAEARCRTRGHLTLIARSSKHENAKQPHWAQARSSCWGTRSPPL